MDVYEIVKILCKENNISLSELEKKLGLTRNTLYKWKTQSPSIERLLLVANYFNVSVDFLVGRASKNHFDDISYLDILDQEAEANLAELIDLLQSYFTVDFITNDNETLISIEDSYKINGSIGTINEIDLKNNATRLLKRMSDKEYDFDDIYKKSILLSLFNGYSSEENFIKELLTFEFKTAQVLSTVYTNLNYSNSKIFILNDFVIEIMLQPIIANEDAYVALPVNVELSIDGTVENYFYNLEIQLFNNKSAGIAILFNPKDNLPTIEHKHTNEYAEFFWNKFSNTIVEYVEKEMPNINPYSTNITLYKPDSSRKRSK
ncbi:helix-turn-helix transcriptional regulator [Listeria monocytogenes]|nr:helix-turn-helix transcriptional regulator [Listeria monocytogenes]MBC1704448.1 helix-turn-helix transcriptional regulator [Listeria welshimeri]EHT9075540.1 helix-turn-helix transcriptional regulator [Listeria monocytogenes]EIZ3974207.1 helix-turn-helix transcriptional regulator [Listeria monocytogenes]EIZ4072516.1 helix-turn-helix transcriptional regulator [Listeria monocytogenes]